MMFFNFILPFIIYLVFYKIYNINAISFQYLIKYISKKIFYNFFYLTTEIISLLNYLKIIKR